MTASFKRNQEIELTIDDLAFGGQGLARVDDFIIFFARCGTPGERVKAKIKKVKQNYAEARIVDILEKSPLEIAAPCPYFRNCGGCRFQNLPYAQQTKYLERQIDELYRHLGGFSDVPINPIIPSDEIFRYRNKMEFAFSDKRWLLKDDDISRPKDFALGLRIPDNYYKAIDIDDCLIAPAETAKIIPLVRDFALRNQLIPYNLNKHTGDLRHLVLRKGILTDQIMINFVTSRNMLQILKPLTDTLIKEIPNVRSIVNTVTQNVSGKTTGEAIHHLTGELFINEQIGDLTFKISPASFFQTNTRMAAKLYEIVRQFVQPLGHQIIWDLFCGTGSIGLYLARDCRQVIGLEIVADAVSDAQENARLNAIDNAIFRVANLEKDLNQSDSLKELPNPDIIVVDPPRGGLTPQLINIMRQVNPARIVYVSCNPASQVRDLKLLTANDVYRITRVQPLDLFPHTPHIETVALLER